MVLSKGGISAGLSEILFGLATALELAMTSAGFNAGCLVWLMTGVRLIISLVGVPAAMD